MPAHYPGVTIDQSGRLLQLARDHPFKRLNRLEIFRRDLVLGNREVEFSFNAQHQIDHVHRSQTDIDQPRIRRNLGIDRILHEDRLDQRNDAITDIGVKTLHIKKPSRERADFTAGSVEKLWRAFGVNTASRFNANAMREK